MGLFTSKTTTKTVLEQVQAAHAQAVEEVQLAQGEIAILEEQLETAKKTAEATGKLVEALGGIIA